ncbi:DUF1080 domain-containing protein [uncultured Maribacter sp.]|uniref:3-keto-disaccharide hydrolase n=1 Tax=uncultured Maribacter sp. TaxID=431308 RepID=UPI0026360A7C|nr:DUF1080 domain-containing protein [uncultured Maribacter sp.]
MLFVVRLIIAIFILSTIGCEETNDGYTALYNGKDVQDWDCQCRGADKNLPKKVFAAGNNGEMHVFKDFPNEYGVFENKNETHCMFFTHKKYSRYSFKFDYKWGEKIFNNFKDYQYDAGMYFHVFNAKIWPEGIEYQVRYNHIENRNHTGDIWNSGSKFDWSADENVSTLESKTYLPMEDGGVLQPHKWGEHRALKDATYNGLNSKWNQCEVIVMADAYAIFKLNGKVVNVITNLKHKEGVVGLQAETAEIFYRNIKIKEFNENIPIEEFLGNPKNI